MEAVRQGFRVTTNSTFFEGVDPAEVRGVSTWSWTWVLNAVDHFPRECPNPALETGGSHGNLLRDMRSPFPGMDPWLEQRWRDVHARLIVYIANQLQAQLPEGHCDVSKLQTSNA